MSVNITDSIIYESVQTLHPVARETKIDVITENKISRETIVAETASPHICPNSNQEIIAEPSAPSINDVINEDGILSSILSNLTFREAVATSVVSPRWRNIWTHRPKLDFGAQNMFDDHIIILINDTDSPFNKVEKSELMLAKTDQFILQIRPSSSIEDLCLVSCTLKPLSTVNGLNSLRKLTLACVDVTGEDVARLLSNCLKYLKLDSVPQLVTINIPHPLSQLQTSIARECKQLRGEIKINAVNLESLGYRGYPVNFVLRQSSLLVDASICFQTEESNFCLDFYLNKLSSNLPHLQDLVCKVVGDAKISNLSRVPNVFIHLKYLTWSWGISGQEMGLGHLATLLKAAPFLEQLEAMGLNSVHTVHPVARGTKFDVIAENKISIETIIVGPEQEIIADSSTPSINDVINEDGILSSILSNLTFREAVATSLVSPRWRNIWTHRPKLDFSAQNMFDDHVKSLIYDTDSSFDNVEKSELMLAKTDQFICSVNSVIQQLQLQPRSKIDQFKLRYFLHKIHTPHLDAWVSFAIQSKTTLLGLYLRKPFLLYSNQDKYVFPCHLLGPSSSIEDLFIVSCSLKPLSTVNGLSNLKNLTLELVDVTGEDIARLLSNSHTLEYLKLDSLPQLVTINIPHPLNQLQTIIARNCKQLRGEININAVNLETLGYYGYPVDFILGQSSLLVDAYICFQTVESNFSLDFYLNKLSSNLPHLGDLVCDIVGDAKVSNLSRVPNVFIHLKYLTMSWDVIGQQMGLGHLVTLLKAAPFLEGLGLALLSTSDVEEAPDSLENLRETLPKHPHAHLKELQFVCFHWDKSHIEFTLYLIMNAVELQFINLVNSEELGEVTIEKLRQELPAKVTLKILNEP